MRKPFILCFIPIFLLFQSITATQANGLCASADNHQCLIDRIETLTMDIEEPRWRDRNFKELATSAAITGDLDRAERLIGAIENGDTRAMTIRAIGMALAAQQDRYDEAGYNTLFARLAAIAETIEHDGARGIAYTYIAMSQAFAGLDAQATETAKSMTNSALRNKAFGEAAEIQADRGDIDAAFISLSHIDSLAFRNKAIGIVGDIFLKNRQYNEALRLFQSIQNPTRQAEYLQKLLTQQQEEAATPLSELNKVQ